MVSAWCQVSVVVRSVVGGLLDPVAVRSMVSVVRAPVNLDLDAPVVRYKHKRVKVAFRTELDGAGQSPRKRLVGRGRRVAWRGVGAGGSWRWRWSWSR